MANETRPRILVVDDEPQLTRVLQLILNAHGFEAIIAADGQIALELFKAQPPALVLTDLTMPRLGGLELCRKLRALSQVPIIVISMKGDEPSKVEALDLGADDYLAKPFGTDELLARIRALLRRTTPAPDPSASVLQSGDFLIDFDAHRILVCGREVYLTPKEFNLLVHFIKNAGKVLTHRRLLAAVWGEKYAHQTERLRVTVANIRKKIEPDVNNPRYILTEPWVGYRFATGGH
jgi:two-component system KDP operon response regulator KdpE